MPDQVQEPKTENVELAESVDSISDMVDKAFAQEPQERSPESPATDEKPEAVTDTDKTDSTADTSEFVDVPKGFANHPAWQKQQQKLKEAAERAKTLESQLGSYTGLLGDPHIFKRHLELQGYSENKIRELMRDKGFQVEEPKQQSDMVELMCKKLGWDMGSLNNDQKAYLKDQIELIKAVADHISGEKVKKYEDRFAEMDTRSQVERDYAEAKKQAKEEFPDLDWDKEIEPAMQKYLDDLEQKDPQKRTKLDLITIYEKATRQILREKRVQEERQEARNGLKKDLRPLKPGAAPAPSQPKIKGKNVAETVDKWFQEKGWRE